SEAFQWAPHPQNGSSFFPCAGDNVTFPWTYVTESDENVIVTFWFSGRNASIAGYFADEFSTYSNRVTYAGNAGVTLSDVSKGDDDTYGVSVMLYGKQEPVTRYSILSVVEPPRTVDGKLHVEECPPDSSHTGNASWSHAHTCLKCGEFLTLGSPPVAVVWKDPSGNRLTSTSFADGYFHIDLPHHAGGGNYTCFLDQETEAMRCIPSDSPLMMDASYFVETMETLVSEQTEDLQDLKSETDMLKKKLEALSSSLHIQQQAVDTQNNRDTEELLRRLSDVEKANEQLQKTAEDFKMANEQLLKTTENQTAEIANLCEQVDALQKAKEDLQKTNVAMEDKLQNLQRKHNELASEHSHLLDDVRQDHAALNTSVQRAVASFKSQLDDLGTKQEAHYDSLQADLELLQNEQDSLTETTTNQSLVLSEVLATQQKHLEPRVGELEQSMSSLTTRLNTQAAVQNHSYSDLREDLDRLQLQQNNLVDVVHTETQSLHGLAAVQARAFENKSVLIDEMYQALSSETETRGKELNSLRDDLQNLVQRVQTGEETQANSTALLQTRLDGVSQTLETQTAAVEAVETLRNNVTSLQAESSEFKALSSKLRKHSNIAFSCSKGRTLTEPQAVGSSIREPLRKFSSTVFMGLSNEINIQQTLGPPPPPHCLHIGFLNRWYTVRNVSCCIVFLNCSLLVTKVTFTLVPKSHELSQTFLHIIYRSITGFHFFVLTGSQAAFHAVLDNSRITSSQPIVFRLVGHVGGGYDSDTGVYTAPFSGWYTFHVQLFPHISTGADVMMDLFQSGSCIARVNCYQRAAGSFTCRTGITVHVDASDRLWVQTYYQGPYWTASFDNFFSGVLVTPD
ncbi:hypothetical protein BaRGS_00029348, partial [Batillaria attramentaria]